MFWIRDDVLTNEQAIIYDLLWNIIDAHSGAEPETYWHGSL